MFGKVSNALIRREADAYRAQGLQEEALALFRKILASPVKLPPDVKAGIEQQILEIEAEISGIELEECQQLSEEQIAVIKQGWSESAVIDDFVVCAQELHALGRHGDALEEFRRSIQNGYSPGRLIPALSDCFIHLYGPEEMPGHLNDWTAKMFQDPGESFNFMLSLAEQMLKDGNREHSAALGRHLADFHRTPPRCRKRLDAIITTLTSSSAKQNPLQTQDHSAPRALALSRSFLRRIRDAVRSLVFRG
jgi:tetratricopeptide (TPR) repeat protein